MKRSVCVYPRRVLLVGAAMVLCTACSSSGGGDAPKLAVMIGIDQFRSDYLERYDEAFTGGFRRLKDEGLRVDRALVDHAPTLSWPGHTTLATGAHPRTHGIVSNAWFSLTEDGEPQRTLAMVDPDHAVVDHPDQWGASPLHIRVSGIADWFRGAHPEAKTVALSTGPALAVTYGGLTEGPSERNHVYWLASSLGKFITTTYYRDEYPDWVRRFNEDQLPQHMEARVWESSVPQEYRHLARADENPFEGDGQHTTFPHRFEDQLGRPSTEADSVAFNRWFYNYSPGQNEALFALARQAVESLSLGQDEVPDLLTIAVKTVDRIGHDYGPHSLEQLDNVLRIDRELGTFLEFLDEAIGRGNYVVVISADHGAPNVVEYDLEQGRAGRRVGDGEVEALLACVDRVVRGYAGPEEGLPDLIANELEQADFVARAMTAAELAATGSADGLLSAYRNAYMPGRTTTYPLWTREMIYGGAVGPRHPAAFGVMVEYVENYGLWSARSTHGSAYRYDREVPILLLGTGVEPGVFTGAARTIDVAPTLAYLAGVGFPETVDGAVLGPFR